MIEREVEVLEIDALPQERGDRCVAHTGFEQIAARHADPRMTTVYHRRRENFDRHDAYVVVAFVAGG
jgi:hypothetical protein